MISVEIIKANSYYRCYSDNCKKDPKYISEKQSGFTHIKMGSSFGKIVYKNSFHKNTEDVGSFYVCGGCLDDFINEVKSKFDKKFWAFQ